MVSWATSAASSNLQKVNWSSGQVQISLLFLQVTRMRCDGISLDISIFSILQPRTARMRLRRKHLQWSTGMSYHPVKRSIQWPCISKMWVMDDFLVYSFAYRFLHWTVQGDCRTRPTRGCCIWHRVHDNNAQCTNAPSIFVPEAHPEIWSTSHSQKVASSLIRPSQQWYEGDIQLHWKCSKRVTGSPRLTVLPH